jgi:fermentation-respiration switch protein FrsA (DUF1100 family)
MMKLIVLAVAVVAILGWLVRSAERRMAFFPTRGEEETPRHHELAFESATLSTDDGEQLNAWLIPAERPRALVVYFHGNGGNLSVWLPVLSGIVRQGYSVAAIDYRGYGKSTGQPSEQGLYRDVDAALAWSARLQSRDVPTVYWGRSLGTAVAAYAATKGRPDGLILESGFPDARSLIRDSKMLTVLAALSSYRFPTAQFAKRAGCPVLVMHGDRDEVIAFRQGRALYEALDEPKQFEVLPGGTHNEPVPPDSRRYWAAIDEFISSLR